MFSILSLSLLPAILGALLTLVIILKKGDICPGQRGRIYKQLLNLGILGLVAGLTFWPIALTGVCLLAFYSQVRLGKKGKTTDTGPEWLLYFALLIAAGCCIYLSLNMGALFSFFMLGVFFLLGAGLAHVLLIAGRTRLQAFHTLLPVIGVLATMAIAVVVLVKGMQLEPKMLEMLVPSILVNLGALLVSIVLWVWHLFTRQKPVVWPVLASLLISYTALTNLAILIGV